VYLRAPGIDACGLAFAGLPGIPHFGHAGPVAWCVTNAAADTDDVYVERFDMAGRYEFRGEWIEPDRRSETIRLRGGGSVEVESVLTRHGPLVSEPRDGAAIALCSAGLRSPGHGLAVLVPQLRARSAGAVDAALAHWVDPANNWLLADASGRIAYRTAGHLPLRTGVNAWFPVPGWTGAHEWEGVRGYDSLPKLDDPGEGLIVTANQRIDDGASISPDFAVPGRAARIRERLGSRSDISPGDLASIHLDDVTIPGRRFVRRLRGIECDGDARRAMDMLAAWDGRMSRDSAGAALYAAMRSALARLTAGSLSDLAQPPKAEPPGSMPVLPRLWTYTRSRPRDERALAPAAAMAWRELADLLGPDPSGWRWGALHRSRHAHGLARLGPEGAAQATAPGVEVDGDGECVLATHFYPGVTYEAVQGPCARYVLQPGAKPAGGWVVPLGASGDPSSEHFADQQAAWARGELLAIES
jgi:penicillin amidase